MRKRIMKIGKRFVIVLSLSFLLFGWRIQACSMYKITADGKTMVGCNEDAWRTTSKIWFENAVRPNEYAAAFTGSREVSSNKTAPQSGMNEKGLSFSRLVAYYPKQSPSALNRIEITDEVEYLTDILHSCATVEEVKSYIEEYNRSVFSEDVFIYIDRTGKYLVVEPYELIEGNEAYYVLSNFCPSITDNDKARKLERYRKGEDFLKTHPLQASLSFCAALSDSMHVCRSRNGDGTLLSSIWDTQEGWVNLYFYHSFESSIRFNLAEELLKGDHSFNIPELFPNNKEFQRLESYKTPFNTPVLRVALVVLGGMLTLLSLLFGIGLLWNRALSAFSVLLISVHNLLLTAYLFVLATHIYIFYFDAPYQHYSSLTISASSYLPFLLLISFIPFTKFTIVRVSSREVKSWTKTLLVANNFIYLMLIVGFAYWGLYSVWN